jgi:hypothetical protein
MCLPVGGCAGGGPREYSQARPNPEWRQPHTSAHPSNRGPRPWTRRPSQSRTVSERVGPDFHLRMRRALSPATNIDTTSRTRSTGQRLAWPSTALSHGATATVTRVGHCAETMTHVGVHRNAARRSLGLRLVVRMRGYGCGRSLGLGRFARCSRVIVPFHTARGGAFEA